MQQQTDLNKYKIFVGDLDQSLDESRITAFFNKFGPIKGVELKKDNLTQESKGYAFVEFTNATDAEKAITEGNGQQIELKQIRVSQFKNPRESDPNANLYLTNINDNLSSQQIKDYFAKYGPILSFKLGQSGDGKRLGYGYLQFEKENDAKKALQEKHKIGEFDIEISAYVDKQKREEATDNKQKGLYITNINPIVNSTKVYKLEQVVVKLSEKFSKYGEITQNKVIPHKSQFYAFITFKNQVSISDIVNETNEKIQLFEDVDTKITVSPLQSKSEQEELIKRQIYTRLLKKEISQEQLKEAFSKFGEISLISMGKSKIEISDKNSSNVETNYAFITYSKAEDAERAIFQVHGDRQIERLYHERNIIVTQSQTTSTRQKYYSNCSGKPLNKTPMMPPYSNAYNNAYYPPMMMFPPQMQQPFYSNRKPQYQGYQNNRNNYQNNNFRGGKRQNYNNRKYNSDRQNKNYNNKGGYHQQQQQSQQQQNNYEQEQYITLLENKQKLGENETKEVWKELGVKMYPKVSEKVGQQLASKITGMLVDLQTYTVRDIVETLNNQDQLNEQIEEAKSLLEGSQQ